MHYNTNRVKIELKYVGKTINIKSIRDCILDNALDEQDAVLLNPNNFDDLVLEFRETYSESLKFPFYFLRVLIKEDKNSKVPLNRVGIIRNDTDRLEGDFSFTEKDHLQQFKYATIYRCGWCGNVVDFDGSEFDSETRLFKIKIHQLFNKTIQEQQVSGNCCARNK